MDPQAPSHHPHCWIRLINPKPFQQAPRHWRSSAKTMACRSLDTTRRGVDVAHRLELTSPRSRAPYAGRTRRLHSLVVRVGSEDSADPRARICELRRLWRCPIIWLFTVIRCLRLAAFN
jgi:hypothetical protein